VTFPWKGFSIGARERPDFFAFRRATSRNAGYLGVISQQVVLLSRPGARVLAPATPSVRIGRQEVLSAGIGIMCRPAVQRRGPRPAPPARPESVAIEPECESGGVTPDEGLAAARSAGPTA